MVPTVSVALKICDRHFYENGDIHLLDTYVTTLILFLLKTRDFLKSKSLNIQRRTQKVIYSRHWVLKKKKKLE